MTEPTAAVSATDEPEMQPNMVEATMLTSAMPPRMKPTNTLARFTSRSAMPPTAMIAPQRMKNGIASSENPLMPPDTFSITASSGMPVQSAPRMAARPSAYATGMPMRHTMVKLPTRMRTSMAHRYSVEIGLS